MHDDHSPSAEHFYQVYKHDINICFIKAFATTHIYTVESVKSAIV